MITIKKLDEIVALAEKATPMDLASAERRDEGFYDCPLCGGEGEVEGEVYVNVDSVAQSVGFFGIGDEFGNAEKLWKALDPQTVLELCRLARKGWLSEQPYKRMEEYKAKKGLEHEED